MTSTLQVSDTLATPADVVSSFQRRAPEQLGEGNGGTWLENVAMIVCTFKRAASLNRLLDSLGEQLARPAELIIVDASPDAETERALLARDDLELLAQDFRYFRVAEPLRGVTRQLNFALDRVTLPRVAVFDDDIVLLSGCLAEMDGTLAMDAGIVGVGAFIDDPLPARHRFQWLLRRWLGIVSSLAPGSYCRSGLSVSWSFLEPTEAIVDGDWLPGGAVMWETASARAVGFEEAFSGYCNAHDLFFSLRMKARGRLVVAGRARVLHLSEPSSRPDAYQMGYEYLTNAYHTHRLCLTGRTFRDVAWFMYAQGLDTLLYCTNLVRPTGRRLTWPYIKGRVRFFVDLALGRGVLRAR